MGVWIETTLHFVIYSRKESHPSWVCGLKLDVCFSHRMLPNVTPFMGVWIETDLKAKGWEDFDVTPFMGVWIETKTALKLSRRAVRHTLHGCVD